MKSEYLLLANKHSPTKHGPCAGWYVSEKLDGIRAFWDGGISRGLAADQVPYANTTKHGRYVEAPIATGLWTRYGQPVQAPGWWLDSLPRIPLDGELWCGRGGFQRATSITRSLASTEWSEVKYMVFDSPPLAAFLAPRAITNTGMKKVIPEDAVRWGTTHAMMAGVTSTLVDTPFYSTLGFAKANIHPASTSVAIHEHVLLPGMMAQADKLLREMLKGVESAGGEGLMLRSPISTWKPERSWNLLKMKTLLDDEATVLGYKWGKPTDLDKSITGDSTNKLLGLMGCITVKFRDVVFDIGTGFTEAERVMGLSHPDMVERTSDAVQAVGRSNPGLEVADWIHNPKFPVGSRITFRYRELTKDGVPKEARYWRPA